MALCLIPGVVHADSSAHGVVGKEGWLFTDFDVTTAADNPGTDTNLDLIKRFNKVLVANGITMAMTIAPMKMRVYAEYLPPTIKTNEAMVTRYEHAIKVLRASQVNTIDLLTPFLNPANKKGPFPLFLKLDTHWSPSGVLLASETIKAGIESNPALKKALDATPAVVYKMDISKNKKTSNLHDLVTQIPQGQSPQNFPREESLLFTVMRAQPKNASTPPPEVTLLGTSNSSIWLGLPDALSYALQRDILVDVTTGDKGSWYATEKYLRSDAFQNKPPKLFLWEMEDRDLIATPNYKYREASYKMDNTEWLLKASALVQQTCKASSVSGKLGSVGLAANSANQKAGGITAGSTSATDFIEINFNYPIGKLDYVSAKLATSGSSSITLEASGPDVPTRQFTLTVFGDSAEHAFKYPLPSNGKGYTKVRILPGKTSGFSFQGLQICRLPDDLLN